MVKKLLLDVDDDLWTEVSHFKIDFGGKDGKRKTYNEAVVELIKRGLKAKK